MADAEAQPIKLQVANSRPEDSGRGLAHIPRSLMGALGLTEGDVIEIVGKRVTPARAVLPYSEDEGLEILRIDGLQRANAGVGAGDFIEVRKAASNRLSDSSASRCSSAAIRRCASMTRANVCSA